MINHFWSFSEFYLEKITDFNNKITKNDIIIHCNGEFVYALVKCQILLDMSPKWGLNVLYVYLNGIYITNVVNGSVYVS